MTTTQDDVNTLNITISKVAQQHFKHLLEKDDTPNTNLRMFVVNPKTPRAEVGLTYCPPNEEKPTDLSIPCDGFILYVDEPSKDSLFEANVDYQPDDTGGQLSVKAPHLKGQSPDDSTPLLERVEYVIQNEINPALAAHRGMVTLMDLTDDGVVSLQFGGGCQGCGMVDMTLKHGIEKTLKDKFPEITSIRDVTTHAEGNNPYY